MRTINIDYTSHVAKPSQILTLKAVLNNGMSGSFTSLQKLKTTRFRNRTTYEQSYQNIRQLWKFTCCQWQLYQQCVFQTKIATSSPYEVAINNLGN